MKKISILLVLFLTVAIFSATYEFLTIDDLKNGILANGQSVSCDSGDIAKIAGYYTAGDGAAHTRICSGDTTTSSIEVEGQYWNIVPVNGEVSTAWYGLDGRTTAQSDLLEDALNSGYKVTSPPGFTYLIDRTLKIYAEKILMDFNSSTIKCHESFSTPEHFYMLDLKYAQYGINWISGNLWKNNNLDFWEIKIRNTCFDGNSDLLNTNKGYESAALVMSTSNVTIENCKFRMIPGGNGHASAAILVKQGPPLLDSNGNPIGGGNTKPSNLFFLNNIFEDCAKDMIGAIFSQGNYNVIKNNQIKNFGDTPIALNGVTSNSIISGNIIEDQNGHGIALENGCSNTVVSNNVITKFGSGGIILKYFEGDDKYRRYDNITISNNIIVGAKEFGLYSCWGIGIPDGAIAYNISINNNVVDDIPSNNGVDGGILLYGSNLSFTNNRVRVHGNAVKISGSSILMNGNSITSLELSAIYQAGDLSNPINITNNSLIAANYGIKLNANSTTAGLNFDKSNKYIPLGLGNIASTPSNFLTGRSSINKLLCNDDGVFTKELRLGQGITILPYDEEENTNGDTTIVLNTTNTWHTSSSTITDILVLSNYRENIYVNFRWGSSGNTILIDLRNKSSRTVTIDDIAVKIEGTRFY